MIESIHKKLSTRDHFLTQEAFDIFQTNLPGVLKTEPQPQDLDAYYDSSSYLSHDDTNTSLFARLYRFARNRNLKTKFQLISKYEKAGKILDVGAGNGSLVKYLMDRKLNVEGYEPSELARKIAYQKGVQLLDHLPKTTQDYQVIQMFHVLEHVLYPVRLLNELHDMMQEDGTLIIALPNYKSLDARIFKKYWAGYDVPRHLYHFDKNGIIELTRNQFELIDTRNMWFDSLYVSILSARYKKWFLPMVTGILVGVLSNIAVLWNKQPSSRIYIFQKRK